METDSLKPHRPEKQGRHTAATLKSVGYYELGRSAIIDCERTRAYDENPPGYF